MIENEKKTILRLKLLVTVSYEPTNKITKSFKTTRKSDFKTLGTGVIYSPLSTFCLLLH